MFYKSDKIVLDNNLREKIGQKYRAFQFFLNLINLINRLKCLMNENKLANNNLTDWRIK